MIRFEKYYLSLPGFLQRMVVDLRGRVLRGSRYSAGFLAALSRAESRADWSVDRVREYAGRRLAEHLKFARHCPYWQKVFLERSVNADASDPFHELSKLPVLTKDTVRANLADIACPLFSAAGLLAVSTSGTTGAGLAFPETKESEWERWAVWWRYRLCLGIGPEDLCAHFGGKPIIPLGNDAAPYWRNSRHTGQVLFSSYHLNLRTVRAYVAEMSRSGVTWVHGYPSVLALFAGLMIEAGVAAPDRVRLVTTGAENLAEWQRELIGQAFGVPVRQHYGLAESTANFSETAEGRMYVDEDFAGVEFVGAGNSLAIVGTNWHNHAFPLFRYDSGDLCSASCAASPPAAMLSRRVETIDGRAEDYLVLRDGTHVGRLDQIFKDQPRIREAQIRQSRPGAARFHVVTMAGYDAADERRLRASIDLHIGVKCDHSIVYEKTLPRTPQGKLRLVVVAPGSQN